MLNEGVTPTDHELEVDRLRKQMPSYPMRLVYVLMVVQAIDGSDRALLGTVFEDVKAAFHLSDTKLGVLTAAYSVVATISVLPFGFLADRVNRVWLIAIGFVPWSLSCFWSAGATSYGQLFASRLFLGSIEATNGPSTPSLLGDYYPVDKRGRVMGIYGVGGLLGSVFGLAIGGVLAQLLGWRGAFASLGVIGLITGAAITRLLPEPKRGIADALHIAELQLASGAEPTPIATPVDTDVDYRHLSVGEAIREVARVKTMWVLLASQFISGFFFAGLGTWVPTYYRRYFDMSAASAGGIVAGLTLFAVVGIIAGSKLSDRYVANGDPGGRMRLAVWCQAITVVAFLVGFGSNNLALATLGHLVAGFFTGFPIASVTAASVDVLVPHLRGRGAALTSITRVVGTALAPVTFGLLSDAYSLRTAWLGTLPLFAVGAVIMIPAIKSYPRDMRRAQFESLRQSGLEGAA